MDPPILSPILKVMKQAVVCCLFTVADLNHSHIIKERMPLILGPLLQLERKCAKPKADAKSSSNSSFCSKGFFRPLVRSQLRPASLDSHDGLGPRRRGRPPGSGNRKSMEPKFGPQGYKKFHSRSEAYTGVYRTRGGRWRAQFSHQGQVVQLGMFDDEKVAAHRWDLEAIRLRGPLTQLNLPAYKDLYIELVSFVSHSID